MAIVTSDHCPLKRVGQVRKKHKRIGWERVLASNEHVSFALIFCDLKKQKQAKTLNIYAMRLMLQLISSHEFSTDTSKSGSQPYHKILVVLSVLLV